MAHIVLIGAGGTGLSSLGFLLSDIWYTNIIGVDSAANQITHALAQNGVQIIIGHGIYTIQPWDLVIYSDACPDAPEVLAARSLHASGTKGMQIPQSYFTFLGEISKYFETIAIAGTHGKSTTTSLMTYALSQCDPQLWLGIIGALVPQLNHKNYRINTAHLDDIKTIFTYIITGKNTGRDESLRKKYRFVIEADEFNRHFLQLDVDHAIILNAELDHSDIYPNEEIYLATYVDFISRVKGRVFAIAGEKGIAHLASHCPKITLCPQESIPLLHIFGDHNQKNATLISRLATDALTIPRSDVLNAMESFTGLRRRMEYITTTPSGARVYSDYGHHPTEILAVYHAFRQKYPTQTLSIIFQPHQARRVLEFWEDFVNVIMQFDERLIYSIYAAREDLPTLLHTFPSRHTQAITTIDQLGEAFSLSCQAPYTTDYTAVSRTIMSAGPETIICICSAGWLDFDIRKEFSEEK
jgi:UDP-N-acetylmuramate--alanine ligase